VLLDVDLADLTGPAGARGARYRFHPSQAATFPDVRAAVDRACAPELLELLSADAETPRGGFRRDATRALQRLRWAVRDEVSPAKHQVVTKMDDSWCFFAARDAKVRRRFPCFNASRFDRQRARRDTRTPTRARHYKSSNRRLPFPPSLDSQKAHRVARAVPDASRPRRALGSRGGGGGRRRLVSIVAPRTDGLRVDRRPGRGRALSGGPPARNQRHRVRLRLGVRGTDRDRGPGEQTAGAPRRERPARSPRSTPSSKPRSSCARARRPAPRRSRRRSGMRARGTRRTPRRTRRRARRECEPPRWRRTTPGTSGSWDERRSSERLETACASRPPRGRVGTASCGVL
jgi:hypothetical protein